MGQIIPDKPLRVVVWSTGTIGRHAIAGVDAHPDLELVGVWTSTAAKDGKDAGELAELGRELGIKATTDRDALIALAPDAIVHTAMADDRVFECIEDLTAFVEAGINVTSSGPVLLQWPEEILPPEMIKKINDACRKGNASMHINGIDPGFANDVLPLVMTSLSQRIDEVRVMEICDYSTYYQPVVMNEIFGFGKPMDEIGMIFAPGILTMAWGSVVRQIAAGLDITLDEPLTEDVARREAEWDTRVGERRRRQGHHGRRPLPGDRQGRRRPPGGTRAHHPHRPRAGARVGEAAGGRGRLLPHQDHRRADDERRLHPSRRARRPQRVRDDHHRTADHQRAAGGRGRRARHRPRHRPAAGHGPRSGGRGMSILDRFSVEGQVAIVTGAGRGLGAGTAVALAEAGADVVISARTADQLEQVAEQIRSLGRQVVVVPADLSDLDAVAGLAQTAYDELGRLDTVVNNVGGTFPRAFLDTSPRFLTEAFSFNVATAHALTRAAVPFMLKSPDGQQSVVNISSMMGRTADRGFVAYGTAKAALAHWTRMAAQDLAPRIRVNGIYVGSIMTSALEYVAGQPEMMNQLETKTPLGRVGEPEDIAAGVLYLASQAGQYVTGKLIEIDGGIQQPTLDLGMPDLT